MKRKGKVVGQGCGEQARGGGVRGVVVGAGRNRASVDTSRTDEPSNAYVHHALGRRASKHGFVSRLLSAEHRCSVT